MVGRILVLENITAPFILSLSTVVLRHRKHSCAKELLGPKREGTFCICCGRCTLKPVVCNVAPETPAAVWF